MMFKVFVFLAFTVFFILYGEDGYSRTVPQKTLSAQISGSSSAYEATVISGQCIQNDCGDRKKSYKIRCQEVIFGACSNKHAIATIEPLMIGERYIVTIKKSRDGGEFSTAFRVLKYGGKKDTFRVVNDTYLIVDEIKQHKNHSEDGPAYSYFSYLDFKKYIFKHNMK